MLHSRRKLLKQEYRKEALGQVCLNRIKPFCKTGYLGAGSIISGAGVENGPCSLTPENTTIWKLKITDWNVENKKDRAIFDPATL